MGATRSTIGVQLSEDDLIGLVAFLDASCGTDLSDENTEWFEDMHGRLKEARAKLIAKLGPTFRG